MHRHDSNICGRTMRWYEWLLGLVLMALACGVRADPVYKCTGEDGGIVYQGTPCAARQREQTILIDAAPAYAPSPQYALPHAATAARAATAHVARASREAVSYECRVSNGDVFYRHSPCPHSLAPKPGSGKARSADNTGRLTVTAREVSREEACAAIHRAGAIGRGGHERDQDVSTYERNLGRDPCK